MAKKRKHIDGELINIRRLLVKKPTAILTKIKLLDSSDETKTWFNKLFSDNICRKYICGTPFPKNIHELGNNHKLPVGKLDREFYWYACLFSRYAKEINYFIVKRDNFLKLVMVNDYESAKKLLDEIQSEFGFSLWLIESRIMIKEAEEGFESMKKYTSEIIKDSNNDWLLRYLVNHFSIRAEKAISYNAYNAIISKNAKDLENDSLDDLAQYLRYRVNFFGLDTEYKLLALTYFESGFSLIDQYVNFIRVIHIFVFNNKSISCLKQSILLLNNIKDEYLDQVRELFDVPRYKNDLDNYILIVNSYLAGRYKNCLALCEQEIQGNVANIEILPYFVKSMINLSLDIPEEKNNLYKICSNLMEIILKTEKSHESFLELVKFLTINSIHNWTQTVFTYTIQEYCLENVHNIYAYQLPLGAISNRYIDSSLGSYISEPAVKDLYYNNISEKYSDSVAVKVSLSIALDNPIYIPEDKLEEKICAISKAKLYLYRGQHKDVTEILIPLVKDDKWVNRQHAKSLLAFNYLASHEINECLDLITSTHLNNSNTVWIFPYVGIMQAIQNSHQDSYFSQNISYPIFCNIYSQVDPSARDRITDAYEDFLSFYNLDRPSLFEYSFTEIPLEKVIYFLRYICVSEVMDQSIVFKSTEEIQKERIAICQILIKIDIEHSESYLEEIKGITQKLMINKGIRQIENSKIYVDTDGIKKVVENELRETYSRYLNFLDSSSETKETEPDYVTVEATSQNGTPVQLKIITNERKLLFTSMVLQLRDHFVSSNEHGLDSYLSVGIRHGTLVGQLRSPLETNRLITYKDHETGKYKMNEFWAQIYSNIETGVYDNIDKKLADFSREIDKLIDMLKNQWIQIKTEKKEGNGLFDFQIPITLIEYIESQTIKTRKYEEFVNTVIEYLWGMTELNLKDIRQAISGNFKDQFNILFDTLQHELDYIVPKVDLTDLKMSISSSRTVILNELDRIAAWFKRARTLEIPPYSVGLPIDIALEMIRNIYPNHLINPNINIKPISIYFEGKTLRSMVDIFFILFDNIVKHSKVTPEPKINLEGKMNCDSLTFRIENEVNSEIDFEVEKLKLQQIKSMKNLDNVKKEGGTGLHKIEKIMTVDLGFIGTLDFDLTLDYIFWVDMEILFANLRILERDLDIYESITN